MTITTKFMPDPICEPCLAGKMHANLFPTSNSRTAHSLDLMHMDLKGFIQVTSYGEYKYWIIFVNDCTRFKCSLGLKRKSDALEAFKQFKAYAENLHSRKLKALKDNKGSEFMFNKFEQFCRNKRVER